MYVCVYVCMYVCMYVRIYVCMCVCMYVYIYAYTHQFLKIYHTLRNSASGPSGFLFPALKHYGPSIGPSRRSVAEFQLTSVKSGTPCRPELEVAEVFGLARQAGVSGYRDGGVYFHELFGITRANSWISMLLE